MQPATARLNGSCGASFGDGGLRLEVTFLRYVSTTLTALSGSS
jgi:hypothetical protein